MTVLRNTPHSEEAAPEATTKHNQAQPNQGKEQSWELKYSPRPRVGGGWVAAGPGEADQGEQSLERHAGLQETSS